MGGGAGVATGGARPRRARPCGRERARSRTALDLSEPDGVLLPFLLQPTPDLLERHSRFRTTHGSLISEILNLLAGKQRTSAPGEPARLAEPLSESELRVLRYLPTDLSNQEIASELYVPVNTVNAHFASLRQARHPPPRRGRPASPRTRPARPFLAQTLSPRRPPRAERRSPPGRAIAASATAAQAHATRSPPASARSHARLKSSGSLLHVLRSGTEPAIGAVLVRLLDQRRSTVGPSACQGLCDQHNPGRGIDRNCV